TYPVIEDTLREGLTTSVGTEIGSETEGLVDGKVGLDVEERCTSALFLVEDMSTTAGKDTVDTAHSLFGDLNFDEVNGLKKTRISEESSGIQDTTSSGDDLSTSTVDGIGVECNI